MVVIDIDESKTSYQLATMWDLFIVDFNSQLNSSLKKGSKFRHREWKDDIPEDDVVEVLAKNYPDIVNYFCGIDRDIKSNGFHRAKYGDFSIKFFDPFLPMILLNPFKRTFKALGNNKEIPVRIYLEAFVEGFKEGVRYFKQDFLQILPFQERDKLIKHNLFEKLIDDKDRNVKMRGWSNIGTIQFLTMNFKNMKSKGYYSGVYSACLDYLETFPIKVQKSAKVNTPSLSIVGYFCKLAENAALINRGDFSAGDYCKKVCKRFGLNYSDTVRQNFKTPTLKIISKIRLQVFPSLTEADIKKIEKYIANQKMYA